MQTQKVNLTHNYHKVSISFDDLTVDRCNALADDRSLPVSSMLRILVKDAYDAMQQQKKEQLRK